MAGSRNYNEEFRGRTKQLALAMIALVDTLKYSDSLGVIRKQLIRSATSVAANYRAVCRARSERERFAKLCIVVEEADETLFWIEMLVEAGFVPDSKINDIRLEVEEIVKVMSVYRHKLRHNP